MIMANEDYMRLKELVLEREKEAEIISRAIGNYFEICEIAKNEYIEKFDWAMKNIDAIRARRNAICDEANQKIEAIYAKYNAGQTHQD